MHRIGEGKRATLLRFVPRMPSCLHSASVKGLQAARSQQMYQGPVVRGIVPRPAIVLAVSECGGCTSRQQSAYVSGSDFFRVVYLKVLGGL